MPNKKKRVVRDVRVVEEAELTDKERKILKELTSKAQAGFESGYNNKRRNQIKLGLDDSTSLIQYLGTCSKCIGPIVLILKIFGLWGIANKNTTQIKYNQDGFTPIKPEVSYKYGDNNTKYLYLNFYRNPADKQVYEDFYESMNTLGNNAIMVLGQIVPYNYTKPDASSSLKTENTETFFLSTYNFIKKYADKAQGQGLDREYLKCSAILEIIQKSLKDDYLLTDEKIMGFCNQIENSTYQPKSVKRHSRRIGIDEYSLCAEMIQLILTFYFNEQLTTSQINTDSSKYKEIVSKYKDLFENTVSPPPAENVITYITSSVDPMFVGREDEMGEILKLLNEYGKVVISGYRGIGKTAVKNQFCKLYQEQFPQIYCFDEKFETSLAAMVAKEGAIGQLLGLPDNLSENKKFERVMDCFKTRFTAKDLIVIDNFDIKANDESNFRTLADLPCKVLMTSRIIEDDYRSNFYQYKLEMMKEEDQVACFKKYCRNTNLTPSDENRIKEICALLKGHTACIRIAACYVRRNRMSFDDYYTKLLENGFGQVSGLLENGDVGYEEIKKLFDIAGFTADYQQWLFFMALMPISGVSQYVIEQLNSAGKIAYLNDLIDLGWVEEDSERKLALHPLTKDILHEQYSADDLFVKTINALKASMNHIYDQNFNHMEIEDAAFFANLEPNAKELVALLPT